jgi:hypothetical protein
MKKRSVRTSKMTQGHRLLSCVHIAVGIAAVAFLAAVGCSDEPAVSAVPLLPPTIDAGRDARPPPPVFEDSAVLALGDASPSCGVANGPCCASEVLPLPWSKAGETCIPGYVCQASVCRSAEIGQTCSSAADCPRSGVCEPSGGGSSTSDGGSRDGSVPRATCTTTCNSPADCLQGWTCGPRAMGASQVCQCASAAEACNGRDDDCDGIVDGAEATLECTKRTGNLAAACCGTGTCIDLSTDAKNCGACGRNCLGGTCAAKTCSPVLVDAAADVTSPPLLAVGGRIYWMVSRVCPGGQKRALVTCQQLPCAAPEDIFESACDASVAEVETAGYVSAMTADPANSDTLFFFVARNYLATTGQLFLKRAGSPAVRIFGESQLPRISAMALEPKNGTTPAYLWWGDVAGIVQRCEAQACAQTAKRVRVGVEAIAALAIDNDNVYFATRDESAIGDVIRCPKTGCSGRGATVASLQANVESLVVAGERLFWNEFATAGSVKQCPRSATDCTPLVSPPLTFPGTLLQDDRNIYVTDFLTGLKFCPQDACGTTLSPLAPRQTRGFGILRLAQDQESVFFYDGGLRRIAKP